MFVENQTAIEKNILPLNIIKSEIDATLAEIEALFEAFDDNRSDTSKLTQCIEHFEQLKGVFQVIMLSGASLLVEAMAQATQLSLEQANEERDNTLSKISSSIVLLVRYLEYVELTQSGLPELLFASINELRVLCKEKPLTESHFFELDLKGFDVSQVKPLNTVDSSTRRLRHMYQVGLLGSFKDENLKSNYRMMARALQRLNGLYQDAHGLPLLRICNAAIDALISGNLKLTQARKLMLGRIDRQVKHLLNPVAGDSDEAAVITLIKDCLYLVALAEPNTDLIQSVQAEFNLKSFNLNEALIQQERELMTGPSASVIRSVSGALREEIALLKDKLDVIARSGDANGLTGLGTDLKKVSYTLVMLGLTLASEQLNKQIETLVSSSDFETHIRELADSLVFIERSIARLEQNNTPLKANTSEESPEQALELDRVVFSVVVETRKIIASVQHALGSFAENNFNLTYLENTVENLHSAWGGVFFLNIERAARQLEQSARFISDKLLGDDGEKDVARLHTLADVLVSIDYYLESIEDKKPLGDGALDIAEESLAELGYA